ncbi:MAG TPA: hypothetical protein VF719_12235, partial [Abditibacteriaceae bacterium]
RPARRTAFAFAAACGFAFLLRGALATNFERAGDNAEPMFYAQTTEAYGDCFSAALKEVIAPDTRHTGQMWIHNERQWPNAWYLRDTVERLNITPLYGEFPGSSPMRLVIATEESWAKHVEEKRFVGWHTWTYEPGRGVVQNKKGEAGTNPIFAMWPRASWSALAPGTYFNWWLTRRATQENGVLTEWSSAPAVVATAP